MRSTPKGGFGNRVLNYLCLRQIADQLNVPYFSANATDAKRISGINRKSVATYLPSTWTVFTKTDVHQPQFLQRAREELASGKTIVFKPRLLDVTFAQVASRDSRELVHHRMARCKAHRTAVTTGTTVTLHLRGTDFSQWNPKAIHGSDYYISALDLIQQEVGTDLAVRVCSDDPSHPALEGVHNHLSSHRMGVPLVECADPFQCDFAAMAQADYLVASPSTFATVAGLLGHPKVIYSRQWVEETANRTDKHELYWQKVQNGTVVGLNQWALV